MKDIYVVITMDCERPTTETHPDATGPENYAQSETYIRGYVEISNQYGFPVSFFVHPEVAMAQTALFDELEAEGACMGLHIHPWKFMDGRYKSHFGGLSEADQRSMISEAIGLWLDTFGTRPIYFRTGTFSSNDATFRVLAELGFRGASNSVPGRLFPDLNAIWVGAEPDPHRAHPHFRQVTGTLDLANMPLTVDFADVVEKNGRRFHWDLRPDWEGADYPRIAANIVAQLGERDPKVPVMNLVTHNENDYTDPDDRVCRNFRASLDAFVAACDKAGVRAVGTTFDRICDMVLAEPAHAEDFTYV
jgi:peptidoglycan/xylan/chitin deacetylase (PgdA/CDA1 family)